MVITPRPPVIDMDVWQYAALSNLQPHQDVYLEDMALFERQEPFLKAAFAASPYPLGEAVNQFVQPQQLHTLPSLSESSQSRQTRPGSIDSTVSSLSHELGQLNRRLSIATTDPAGESYRPRNRPAKPKKAKANRITPCSEKHARELELNRKAATKCRNRQKVFIEDLQERCKREEEKMHIQTLLVRALQEEVVALRNEAMRHSFGGRRCR